MEKNKSKSKIFKKQHEMYSPKYFAQAILSCLVGIGVILGIAVILNKKNFSTTFDLTTGKINSLSEQTTQFLKSLNKPVQLICVPSATPNDTYCSDHEDLLNLYAKNSKEVTNLGTLNLADKDLLQKVQPSGFERIILIAESNRSEIDGQITENKLTNALINLIKTKKVVYFLSGSGEPSLSSEEGSVRNYADVVTSLQAKAYEAKEWNIKQGDLPDDAKVLVAGDNNIAYRMDGENIITHFVAKGGKLILIVNPYRSQGLDHFYSSIGLKLEPILLTLNTDTALGQQIAKQNLMRPPVIISNFNKDAEITRVVTQAYTTQAVMPVDGGRPISIIDQNSKAHHRATVLMSAYDAAPISLTEEQRNKIDLNKPLLLRPNKNFDKDKDWNMAVDVEIKAPHPSEVVVFGFSIINPFSKTVPISNELIPLSVAHLYQDKDVVSIPSREFAPKQFNLSRNPGLWLPLFAGILPLITAIAGFIIWMKRREA